MKKFLPFFILLLLAGALAGCTATAPPAASVTTLTVTEPDAAPEVISTTATPQTPLPTAQPSSESEVPPTPAEVSSPVASPSPNSAPEPADPSALTEAEINDLLYMREEEKLAHDVYIALYRQWGLPIFQNIAGSELTHTEAVKALLTAYELDDPAAATGEGEFADVNLQGLYDQLVAEGSESLVAALQVGATIEDLDIVDLQNAVGQTDNPDIIQVYENLMKGSRNHLRSFVGQLQRSDEAGYQPQFLDQATYETIINSPRERGGS